MVVIYGLTSIDTTVPDTTISIKFNDGSTVSYNAIPFVFNYPMFECDENSKSNPVSVLFCKVEKGDDGKFFDLEITTGSALNWLYNISDKPNDVDFVTMSVLNNGILELNSYSMTDLYVTLIYTGGQKETIRILKYNIPYSPICFTGDAIVQTDQGFVNFERLTDKHTIDGQTVDIVTKTKTHEKHLICIDADAFSTGVPFTKTLVSRNHKILYNEEMICAKDLTDLEGVYKTKYRDQLLYNVVISNGGNMVVNGLTVETLDRTNTVAQLYALTPNEFAEAVAKMNQFTESIIKLI